MKIEKIRGLMAEKKISQRKMASMMGISKNTLNAILNGKGNVDTEKALQICEILEIDNMEKRADIFSIFILSPPF